MILEGKKLSFQYSKTGRWIFQGLDVTLSPGQRLGLNAPSGSGKTTLCKLLAGYEKPNRGAVFLGGRPLASYVGHCPVQMIWQHPETAVDPLIKLGDTLKDGWPTELRILNGLHIEPEWLNRYPAELSGGELQRFCIARALGPQTRFLICDEISTMLDLITQAQIWNFLLEEANCRKMGLLIVSHTSALLERLCTQIITLKP